MEEQQEVQNGSTGKLTSYSILPLAGTSRGLGIQVEHSPKVSSQVERAQMDERSLEIQQEQAGLRIDIGVVLHKPKRNVRQSKRYNFEETVSYTLMTANEDPYTYKEAIESQDRER